MVYKTIAEDSRLSYFPVPASRSAFDDMYNKHESCFWTAKELDFGRDASQYATLEKPMKKFIACVLGSLVPLDNIINELLDGISINVSIPEVNKFFSFQKMMENVHTESYSKQYRAIIPEEMQKDVDTKHIYRLVSSIKELTYKNNEGKKILLNACIEGIFLPSIFCVIYWLQRKGGLMPGLCHANELISRDECLHVYFYALLYRDALTNENKLALCEVMEVLSKIISITGDFMSEVMEYDLPEMNMNLMNDYIYVLADNVLELFGEKPIYKVKNPFLFMDQINMKNKENFFEKKNSNYIMESKKTTVFDNEW